METLGLNVRLIQLYKSDDLIGANNPKLIMGLMQKLSGYARNSVELARVTTNISATAASNLRAAQQTFQQVADA